MKTCTLSALRGTWLDTPDVREEPAQGRVSQDRGTDTGIPAVLFLPSLQTGPVLVLEQAVIQPQQIK